MPCGLSPFSLVPGSLFQPCCLVRLEGFPVLNVNHDLIAEIGAHGQYLKAAHTRKHVRDLWYPDLFERGTYSDWIQRGGGTLVERANARLQKILAEHQVEILPADARARMSEIVKRAESRRT